MTIKSYNETTSSYTTELEEHFGTDANGYSSDTLAYDNNGNLTYDGTQAYTYDAWNRLASVAHAYTVAGDVPPAPHVGQAFERMRYDAAGRRIIKEIGNTGDTGYHLRATGAMDATYHDYYNGQSNVEERVGSASGSGYGPGLVIKQRVWGLGYVDELIQTAINSDPTNTSHQTGMQNACDRLYWLYQDANYNVVAVFNASHNYVERYEYSAYGQREVFTSSGSQDGWCYLPTSMSGRVVAVGGVVEPWGINDVGHQGLVQDEESGLVYNRARMLQPTLGRFMQEDPLGYVDGSSVYLGYRANPIRLTDPRGLQGGGGGPPTQYQVVPGIIVGFEYQKGSILYGTLHFEHVFINVDGTGYGFYARSHLRGGGSAADTSAALLLVEGVVWDDSLDMRYPTDPNLARPGEIWNVLYDVKIPKCYDADKFKAGVNHFLSASFARANTGVAHSPLLYNAVAYNCKDFVYQALDVGAESASVPYWTLVPHHD